MLFKTGIRTRLLLTGVVSLSGLVVLAAVAIHSMRAQMIEDRITMVRNLTEVGRHLIQRHYDRFAAGEIDETTAKKNAVEELRVLRWANGEYFFIDDFDGYSVLLPIRPELEGTDAMNLVDSQGRRFVAAQRDAALAGGGIVRYEFTKPGTRDEREKLAHVRPFPPWRWFVATGIYLDDVDHEIRLVLWQSAGVLVVVALVTGLIILLISRSITAPLARLTAVIKRLTQRDYSVQVGGQDRVDEIGDIARAIAVFKKTGQDFEALQIELRRQEERARLDREEALAFQRDSALRLEQTARLISMGEMATSLAHELNQPLAAVTNYCMGCVRRLEAGTENHAALLHAMRKASEQATRASKIIARLRRFLRRAEPTLETQSLGEIIEETAFIAEIDARRHGFAIDVEVPPDLPPVRVDRVMVEQVVMNLLRNAIQAMEDVPPSRRHLVISSTHAEGADMVETAVYDFGRGIDEADRDKIFQPFYTSKTEGMGVGLNICRSIVDFHGGRLWMTPNPVGGAIFHFTLPVGEPA
jgi:signal transduction histidine kinase